MLEPPHRGSSYEYPQPVSKKYEKYLNFYLKIFIFGGKISSVYLNRIVFVKYFVSDFLTQQQQQQQQQQ